MLFQENKNEWTIKDNELETEAVKKFIEPHSLCTTMSVCTSISLFVNYLEKNINFDFIVRNNEQFEENLRSHIKIVFKMTKYAYEGEVTDIRKFEEFFELDIMTSKETKTLKLPVQLYYQIEFLRIGDYVYSEPSIGIIRKLGRSETRVNEFDLEGNRYLPLSKTTVCTEKEKEIIVSLQELDDSLGNKQKTKEFLIKNSEKIEFKSIIVLIKCKFTEKNMTIAKQYANETKLIKFLFINETNNAFLCINLKCDNLVDMVKYYASVEGCDAFIGDCDEILNKKVTQENAQQCLNLLKMSKNKEEYERKLNTFIK